MQQFHQQSCLFHLSPNEPEIIKIHQISDEVYFYCHCFLLEWLLQVEEVRQTSNLLFVCNGIGKGLRNSGLTREHFCIQLLSN